MLLNNYKSQKNMEAKIITWENIFIKIIDNKSNY